MASNHRARNRALHAARAVTLGLAVGFGSGGCFGSHERPDPEPEPGPETADAAVAPDAGRDAGVVDAGPELCDASSEGWEDCCDEHMWDPAWGCFAWGPFVPPAEAV